MKLHDAIVMGKFCGLHTVEECIYNIELHWNTFTEEDIVEFTKDVNLYFTGKLLINWDAVNAEVKDLEKDLEKEYEEDCRNNPPVDEKLELFGDLAE